MSQSKRDQQDPWKQQPDDGGSSLVPMLIAGLLLVVIGYAGIMLFV